MKASTIAALLTPAAANAQWWGGAPDCAQECFSSLWDSATTWPAPTSYCGATQAPSVYTCIESACSATPTAVTSYSSLSSSLCSQWSSCSSAGATGVYTISAPAFTGAWGPGRYGGPGGPHGPGGRWGGYGGGGGQNAQDVDGDGDIDSDDWSSYTRTWTGGVYTVTGCEWNGNVWAGGPGGWGPGGNNGGGGPWAPWGRGWAWKTETVDTVTAVITGSAGSLSTSVGPATVAYGSSGSLTTTSLVTAAQAQQTDPPVQQGAAAAPADAALGVKAVGVALGGVLVVVGLL